MVQQALDEIVSKASWQMEVLSDIRSLRPLNDCLLEKIGLLQKVDELRIQVKRLKFNSVQQISQAALNPLMCRFRSKVKFMIRVNGHTVTVNLQPFDHWSKDADDVIRDYESKLLLSQERIDKLLHVFKLAAHFAEQIHWDRFLWLKGFIDDSKMTVELLEEVFIYGLSIRRVHEPPRTRKLKLRRVLTRIIGQRERRQCFLETYSHRFTVLLPAGEDLVFEPLLTGDEILFREPAVARLAGSKSVMDEHLRSDWYPEQLLAAK